MKKLFLAAALLGATSLSAKAFEGTVKYQSSSSKGKAGPVLSLALKGDKMRMESDAKGGQGAAIMDTKAKKMIVLMPEQKQYMVQKLDVEASQAKGKPTGSLKKTGRSETIAGYKADEWAYVSEGRTSTLWGTTELGAFMGAMGSGPKGQQADIQIPAELKDKGFFPLRMVSAKGGKEGKLEAIEVKPGKLDAALFEAPAGYTEMKMPAMPPKAMEQMKEAMKNMSPEERKMMEKMMGGQGR